MARPGPGLTAADPRAIQGLFDEVAPTYDLLNRILSLGTDQRLRRRTAQLIAPAEGGLVADICGGTGDLALEVARQHPEARVLLVDFAEDMLRLARPKLAASDAGAQVSIVSGDACRLPLPDASCDAVTAAFAFRNLRSVEEGLAEVARVLRPGGRLALLELFRPDGALARVKSLMIQWLVPSIAWVIARERVPAYQYLAGSIIRFRSADEMRNLVEAAGFRDVGVQRGLLGFLTVMGATKP